MGSSVKENGMDLLSSLESSGIALGKHVFFYKTMCENPPILRMPMIGVLPRNLSLGS